MACPGTRTQLVWAESSRGCEDEVVVSKSFRCFGFHLVSEI